MTSFPFLKIARDFGLTYGDVVRFASRFDGSEVNGGHTGFVHDEQLRGRRTAFMAAVNLAIQGERQRRATIVHNAHHTGDAP